MGDSKKELAIKLFLELERNPMVVNQGETRKFDEFDKLRIHVIGNLRPLLNDFFNDKISVEKLKYEVDITNKRNPLWGFRGINGQMFFNVLFNSTTNQDNLKKTLKEVLRCPDNITSAKSKINTLIDFIRADTSAEDKRALPKVKSTLFFLSYFWQIQEPETYPVFYSSLEQTFIKLGFMKSNENLGAYYEEFLNLNKELLNLFRQKNHKVNLWYVEHVFWKYFIENQKQEEHKLVEKPEKQTHEKKVESDMDFIPKVVSNLVGLSLNESDPSEFEKKTGAVFTILGFEVQIVGQGRGRMVDVIAKAYTTQPYILLIDCKARSEKDFKLSAGEERTVIEYIKNFSHDYPRDRRFETHYLIISSGFRGNDESVRRRVKSETGIDVSFITAEALLFLVNKKLQTWDMDLDVIKNIFQREGLITEDIIQDAIGR